MSNVRLVLIIVSIMIVSIVITLVAVSYQISRAQESQCLPAGPESLDVNFNIRTPTTESLPSGYHLRETFFEDDTLRLYYSADSLCPFPRLVTGHLPQKTLLLTIEYRPDIENGTNYVMNQITNHQTGSPSYKYIDINGLPGYGWDSFVIASDSEVGVQNDLLRFGC